MIKTTKN